MKVCFILLVAYLICRKGDNIKKFWSGLVPILFTFIPVLGLLYIQEHLSAMMIMAVVLFVMLIVGGAKFLHLIPISLGGIAGVAFYVLSTEFRKKRLLIFLDPWQDSLGSGWQIIQSLYAISSRRRFWSWSWSRCSKIHVYFRTAQ